MKYNPIKVDVPEKYHDRIKKNVLQQDGKVSIKIILDKLNNGGNHTLLLTDGQIKKLGSAKEKGQRSTTVRFSRRQVEANRKHEGGFLGLLASLAATAIPAILGAVATGAISGAVEKSVSGNGLFLHRRKQCVRVQPVKGGGLYLAPHPPHVSGDGLYLKQGSDIYGEKVLLESPWIQEELPILKIL